MVYFGPLGYGGQTLIEFIEGMDGVKPCPPGSCPLKASGVGALPAVPFHAAIVAGVCKCVPPQVCDS